MKRKIPAAVAIAVAAGAILLARRGEIAGDIHGFVAWVRGAGTPGMMVFAGLSILGPVILIPQSFLLMAAGFAYGPAIGSLIAIPSAVAGAVASFLAGRWIAREWVSRAIARYPRFRAVDEGIGRDGLKIVLLLRLSSLFPAFLLNYALGVTAVRAREYAAGTFLGLLPASLVFVYIGSAVTSAGDILAGHRAPPGPGRYILTAIAAAAIIGLFVILGRISGRILSRELDRTPPGPTPER